MLDIISLLLHRMFTLLAKLGLWRSSEKMAGTTSLALAVGENLKTLQHL